jgi:hypothetical protein
MPMTQKLAHTCSALIDDDICHGLEICTTPTFIHLVPKNKRDLHPSGIRNRGVAMAPTASDVTDVALWRFWQSFD